VSLAAVAVLLLLVAAALAPVATAADGSVAPRLAWWAPGKDIDLSPDGQLAAVVWANLLQVRRTATGELVAEAAVSRYADFNLTIDANATDSYFPIMPRWSPAGDRIAVTYVGYPPGRVSLWAWDGAGLRLEGYVDPSPNVSSLVPAWSPDGRFLAVETTVWDAAARTVVATLEWDWQVRFWMVWTTRDFLIFGYTVTVGTPNARFGLAAWDLQADGVAWYRAEGPTHSRFAVSPDGTTIAYTAGDTLTFRNASTGDVMARWTAKDIGVNAPLFGGVAWSSDGRVLYVANPPGKGVLLAYPSLDLLAVLTPANANTDNYAAGYATFSVDDRYLALGQIPDRVYVFDLTPPPPVLLIGGLLAVAGGGAVAVGYGWRRRRRRNTTTEEGEP
jgi:WD40 repeat protein